MQPVGLVEEAAKQWQRTWHSDDIAEVRQSLAAITEMRWQASKVDKATLEELTSSWHYN